MPKPERIIVVTGDQQPDMDVLSLARVIIRFARQHRALPESAAVAPPVVGAERESA